MRDPFNDVFDMSLLLFIATLMLGVIFIEYRRNRAAMRQFVPPMPNQYLPSSLNVPRQREHQQLVENVAYIDISDAADGEYD